MDYKTEYQRKLITADAAAAMVKSGDWVDYGWAVNTTVAVDPRHLPDRGPRCPHDLEQLAHGRH